MELSKEVVIETIGRYWQKLIFVLGLGLVAVGIASFFPSRSSSEVEIITSPAETASGAESRQTLITVDIEGAVLKPGIYELPEGSRVNDLLVACRGLSAEADREWVAQNLNKAAMLSDGGKFYIPKIGEKQKPVVAGDVGGQQTVSLNQATLTDLQTLPGIGPSFAQKIIDYREAQGGFKSVEELMAVPGIGAKTYAKLKDKITL